jgi:hypothetical protein
MYVFYDTRRMALVSIPERSDPVGLIFCRRTKCEVESVASFETCKRPHLVSIPEMRALKSHIFVEKDFKTSIDIGKTS